MTDDSPWADLRPLLLDSDALVRAVASGRARGFAPQWRRVELRYVDLAAGRRLQLTAYDDTQAHTSNHEDAGQAVDELLGSGFSSWHVETTDAVHQARVTKKGRVLQHRTAREVEVPPDRSHDRAKQRLLPGDDPVLRALGIADDQGRVKPSRQAKHRQVEEMVRALAGAVDAATAAGALRVPTDDDPLRVVDLGCGNAYLTFAAQAWLERAGVPAVLTGVDVKDQSRRHNESVASELGRNDRIRFVVGAIDTVELEQAPDVVLALHACDTATDDALARAVRWEAPLVLAAPCCHHDVAAQLRVVGAPAPYDLLVRDGILRERLADTLTDALRAARVRAEGYRVEVIEFVDSAHTPRNTLLRAVRTGSPSDRAEYDDLVARWSLHPRLGVLLDGAPA